MDGPGSSKTRPLRRCHGTAAHARVDAAGDVVASILCRNGRVLSVVWALTP